HRINACFRAQVRSAKVDLPSPELDPSPLKEAPNVKGDPNVIDMLNAVLTSELTAINQYFIHHKMCENWGYKRLSKKKYEESIGEMKDADAVIERILYLEGVPNMQRLNPVRVGEDPIEQHKLDLALETEAIKRLNAGIALCR